MREYAAPTTAEPPTGNLTDDVVARTAREPRRGRWSARRDRRPAGHDVTAAEFHAEVRAVAKGLVAAGIEAGDRVALLSATRYEWTLFDYAIWFAGAVSVPIYETSSAEQVGWILQRLRGARPSSPRPGPPRPHRARSAHDLADLHHVWSIDDNAVDVLTGSAPTSPTTTSRSGVRPRRPSTWPR